ncbi:MAG: fibronectin type III domain-containing protein [Ignavibacteria bacterium]|nr:fibronectin type III domain-containing protein [Ignavibacteria bacterium]
MKKVMQYFSLFAANSANTGEITLSWDADRLAKMYLVEYKKSDKENKWYILDFTDESVFNINGLKSGKEYLFRVSALDLEKKILWRQTIKKKIK